MTRIASALIAFALLAPVARAAKIYDPQTISEPRDAITALYGDAFGSAWTYRDHGRTGAALQGRFEVPTHATMLPEPSGVVAFTKGRRIKLDLKPGVITVAKARGPIAHAQMTVGGDHGVDVVWQEDGRRVYAVHVRGATASTPRLVASGRIRDVAAAQRYDGGVLVAYQDGDAIKARVSTRAGGPFGAADVLATTAPEADVRASEGLTTHTLHVAWASETSGVQTAATRPDSTEWLPTLVLSATTSPRGLALKDNVVAWATPFAVKAVEIVDGDVEDHIGTPVAGAHVDGVDDTGVIGFTVGGHAHVSTATDSDLDLGPGHLAIPDGNEGVVWAARRRNGEVVQQSLIVLGDDCNPIRFGPETCPYS